MKFTTLFHPFAQSSISSLINELGIPKVVIEIGIFEGNTTFNLTTEMVKECPDYKHYAIDPYGESDDLPDDVVEESGKLFKDNLEGYEFKDHIEFINKPSWDGLIELYNRGVKADLIYVDGDHRAPGVLEDLVLGFSILNKGGVLLCDDCVSWKHDKLQNNPKLAVDAFTHCYWDKIEIMNLPNGYQIAIRKL